MSTKRIIDVSAYQGTIDWDKAKNNIDGAILRCGYGSDITSQDDKQFTRNLSECERLGIPRGVYLYSYAKNETQAKSELAHILRLIKGHTFQLPIFLDCEQAGTEKFAPRACEIICEGLKEAGFLPGVYANTSWWTNYLTSVTAYTRWVAQYNTVCTYKGSYDMWQYTDKGRINGISGNVDVSYCYKDFTGLINNTVNKKSVTEIAQEVIAGKWGNGDERKQKLTEAGYNYTEVQKKVNELTAKKSLTEIAKEVIAGKWGNGSARKTALEKSGYDYNAVQTEVNKLLK